MTCSCSGSRKPNNKVDFSAMERFLGKIEVELAIYDKSSLRAKCLSCGYEKKLGVIDNNFFNFINTHEFIVEFAGFRLYKCLLKKQFTSMYDSDFRL